MNPDYIVRIMLVVGLMFGLSACQEQDISSDIADAEYRAEEPVKAAKVDIDKKISLEVKQDSQTDENKSDQKPKEMALAEQVEQKTVNEEPAVEDKMETKDLVSVKVEQEPQLQEEVKKEPALPVSQPKEEKVVVLGDAVKGKKVAKKCGGCHTFEQGGKNKVGPNLFAVVGKKQGASVGFKYGSYLKNSGATWNEEALRAWVADSKGVAKAAGAKSKMASQKISGTKADDLIAYLKTLK